MNGRQPIQEKMAAQKEKRKFNNKGGETRAGRKRRPFERGRGVRRAERRDFDKAGRNRTDTKAQVPSSPISRCRTRSLGWSG